jgi:ketosteroid isomerase-like protein
MNESPQPAAEPEELGRFFVERANAGDLDGLVAIYEPDAVLAFPPGEVSVGHEEIRRTYADLVAARPQFAPGEPQPTLRRGDLALTSTKIAGGAQTVEVARRQPDGTWRWAIDNPGFVSAPTEIGHDEVLRWVDAYERAWRAPGTDGLAEIFTEDASYSQGPYVEPRVGLEAIARMWEETREADEFRMTSELVAVDADTAVVRVEVFYEHPDHHQYRDLWVLRFAPDGRCRHYEEWPFAPERPVTSSD